MSAKSGARPQPFFAIYTNGYTEADRTNVRYWHKADIGLCEGLIQINANPPKWAEIKNGDFSIRSSFTVAETTKLSVGQALEKLRGTEAPKAKMARLDEKIDTLNQETQRLRAMRRRIERDQQAASTEIKPDSGEARLKRDAQETNVRRVTKLKILGITIAIVIVISILAWGWGLLSP